MTDIYRTFCDYIKENDILHEKDHIIAGVSGGADSICLLLLLHKLSEEMSLRITVVHVNHQLRGLEADADEAFVKDFCKSRKIPCVAVRAAVRKYAFEHDLSLEEAGRVARYQTFYQVARKIAGTQSQEIPLQVKAAVAHHRDDNAETILMNLIRGTGLQGLKGMQPVGKRFGITVVRPLLCLGREDIETYLDEEGVEYRTDSTNEEDEFARNKVRHNIIPELNSINSKAAVHINEAARSIVLAQEFIEKEASKACGLMVDNRKDGLYIDLERFRILDVAVKSQVIRNVLMQLTGTLKDIGRVHIESVLELEDKQTGRRAELPYGVLAVRSYSNIIIRKATADDRLAQDMTDYVRGRGALISSGVGDGQSREDGKNPKGKNEQTEPDAFMIDPMQLPAEPVRYRLWKGLEAELQLIHVNSVTRQFLIAKNEYTKAFDCAKIKGNLVFRKPDLHDEIQFFGGKKTVRKFFIDEKIPQEERKQVLALCDEKQVMWLIGYRMSESYKISEMTNLALQVRMIRNDQQE